jgi:hypothetical protein
MADEKVIIFRKNEKDEYFRKSTEFASADVILRDDAKNSGSVERLSATILKGVQDQLFDMARQKQIELSSKQLTASLSTEYKDIYIDNYIKDVRKKDKSKPIDRLTDEAEKSYELKKKSIDRLAEKEAWRITIKESVADDELMFKFDAKSIFDYAKVHGGGHKDRLYQDVKKIQQRFNNWSEKKFDTKSGKIVDKEVTGVLFPYSEYSHGDNAAIEIKLEKEMLSMVLFLNKNFLKYHLDSYLKVETPNATRLYELLVDYISGNIFVSGRDLTFEYLQKKFNTNYKLFRLFLQRLMTPSLDKINSELGTSISWEVDKKKGRSIDTIKFVISTHDKKILQGIRDEDIDDFILYSFEYYCALLSLSGQRAQGGLKALYEKVRGMINDGSFNYLNKTKEEMVKEHLQNLEDAEELEGLIERDETLAEKYFYDRKYMNIMERDETSFVGSNAIESLEFIRSSYLIPRGFLGPTLSFFTSHDEEKDLISSILPISFKLTEKRSIVIAENNFDSMKTTIEPYLTSTERFIFDSPEHKERFCKVFGIEYFDDLSPALEADVVSEVHVEDMLTSQPVEINLFDKLENIMNMIGNRSIAKNKEKWTSAVDDLVEEYGNAAVGNVINFLTSGNDSALFWLKNITTPTKFIKHFEQIEQVCNVEHVSLLQKIKADPEIKVLMSMMQNRGESEEAITHEVNSFVSRKIESGVYEAQAKEAPWQTEKRIKRESNIELMAEMQNAGFNNIFDYLESIDR